MQSLGIFGIYKEAYKIIFSCRKIFSQIALALILPLCIIYLSHHKIGNVIFERISFTHLKISQTPDGSPDLKRLYQQVSSEWALYFLFQAAYYIFVLIFSLLSTSAVVYNVACMYTNRDMTFKKVMHVVPKVWKRLMVTLLCTFVAFFAYFLLFGLVIYAWILTIWRTKASLPVLVIVLILYATGSLYLTIVWQLASVVSVLEKTYGFKAVMKSKDLVKGNMWVASFIVLLFTIFIIGVRILFDAYVVYLHVGWLVRLGFALLSVLLLLIIFLFGLVIQTIIYFVCKSYHHENIEKTILSEHLEEIYLGEYKSI
ncbi:hypothetical protein RJ639_011672 [Escallonia herrerae]|uniref:Uncharacterized protein n=1 Tax=Escallonia herrerae TaxID=1293975 RepID=A0AA89AMT8_9ASTE|nr:hypothetical protein RJ639_011672 [Escallonia herrerae]